MLPHPRSQGTAPMKTADRLRYEIRTAIECALVYRPRRRGIARAHLAHAHALREQLHALLVASGDYSFAATIAAR